MPGDGINDPDLSLPAHRCLTGHCPTITTLIRRRRSLTTVCSLRLPGRSRSQARPLPPLAGRHQSPHSRPGSWNALRPDQTAFSDGPLWAEHSSWSSNFLGPFSSSSRSSAAIHIDPLCCHAGGHQLDEVALRPPGRPHCGMQDISPFEFL